MKMEAIFKVAPLLITSTLVAETHTVQDGEVLSKIVLKKYPNPDYKIYGPNGKIKDVLKLNPQIKAPHLIYPNQVITLGEEKEVGNEPTPELPINEEVIPQITVTPNSGKWDFSAHYGLKYVSFNQNKTLGSSDVNTIFLNNLQFNAEYTKNDWASWVYLNTYKVKYTSGTASDSRQISTYELGGSYKNYLMTLSLDETPIFKEISGPVEMSKVGLLNIGIGWRKDWQLESTLLSFKSSLKYPLSASSESKVKVSGTKGFKTKAQLQWQYPFYKTDSYELFADWQNDLSYQKLEQKVNWGNVTGTSEMALIEATSSVGIHLKY